MALVIADRVKVTTTTTGTGDISLAGASTGFQDFSAVGDGNTTYYAISSALGSEYEVGIGTYTASGPSLSRDTILASSNSGSAVNFSAGTKDVYVVAPADRSVVVDGSSVSIPNSATVPVASGGTGASTASAALANLGLTATAAELNLLDGVTATTTELNYVDGVTSNIQTQLDGMVEKAGDTMTGALTLSGDPTSASHAATKQYVDTQTSAGIHYHDPVRGEVETNLSATYDNGSSGVGATLTATSNGAFNAGGISDWSTTERVLVYNQTTASQNGVYTVTTVGDGSTAWVLTRATDADSYSPSDPDSFGAGDAFFVQEGDGAGELYVMNTEGTITFGTTNITFTQIASAAIYSAGTDLTLTGTTFSLNASIAASTSGNAATATALATARTIGGVSFDGTANINLPGVNTTGNQNTTGSAATLTTSRTISLSGDVSGSASFDGSANATITATVADDSHNHITSNIDGLAEYIQDTAGAMFSGNTESGISATYQDADGTIDLNVNDPTITLTGDVSGSATMTNLGNVSITATVANDSHTHAFNNLTSKTSGTGDYATTGDLISGKGSGGAALTVNDNKGNANVTFNHASGVPEQDGNAFRIETNTDATSGASFWFEGKSNVTSGVSVDLEDWFTMSSSGATCLGNTVWHAGNDGPGSGLNADTVDGIQASNFLRSDTSDTMSGTLTVSGGNIVLSGSANPEIQFNGSSDSGVDMAIKATPEGLDFYEPEDSNKVHFKVLDDTGVSSTYGYQVNGTSVISSSRVLQNVTGNISQFTNDSGYTTNVGDITGVTAGNGLTGGGSSGSVTLNVGAGTGISVAADTVGLATAGVGAGTYGSTANGTKIDTITVDAYGRVTAVATGATGSSSTTGTVTSVATSGGLTGGTITTSGTISISSDARPNSNQYFGNSGGEYTYYDNGNSRIQFYINSVEDMRLTTNGDLHVEGSVIAYSNTVSDERLKENIVGIDGALDKVAQLNGYTFNYKADGKISAGVIAQEVEKVLPEAVSEKELPLKADDGQEYKVVNYDALHGLLIEAVKELSAKVKELEAKVG